MKRIKEFTKFFESVLEEYEISVKGYDFVVKGTYDKGDKSVDSSESFDIEKVLIEDEDGNLVEANLKKLGVTLTQIEEKILEQIED